MRDIRDDAQGKTHHVLELEESMLSNDYTSKGNLQIQCNLFQTTNGIFSQN